MKVELTSSERSTLVLALYDFISVRDQNIKLMKRFMTDENDIAKCKANIKASNQLKDRAQAILDGVFGS